MKKFITAILAVLYISTSTGAMVHMHYCMGQLADWGLGITNPKPAVNVAWRKAMKKTMAAARMSINS
ncbi:MAG: hypothetical protein IPH34_00115 [Chitinophagaceae bacterium]|nr:hypothetical protein [Chitinophagaceae bacterium]